MEYITRNLESDPGMSQKEALMSLQSHPSFKPGTIIASIRNRKGSWVAELLEPKTAEFPPKSDGGDEGGESESAPPKSDGPPAPGGSSDPDNDGDDDSSPSGDTDKDGAGAPGGEKPAPGGDKPGGGKGDTETAILHVLTQILHALSGGGAPEGMGGPDALGPGPGGNDGPPPPKGGAPGAGGPPGGPAGGPPGKGGKPGLFGGPKAMKPGDTPPGGTPVGAPAFASTKQAGPSVPPGIAPSQGTPVPSGQAGPVGAPAQGQGTCPTCGGPEPCPMHGALTAKVAAYSKRAATISLSTDGTDIKKAVEEARPVLAQYGYTVKQAKRGDGQVHILASRR